MTSLYIHIPFCAKKCLFCSFVIAVGQDHRIDDYLQSLELEAAYYPNTAVQTVYLGGGTPSLLNAAQLEKLKAMLDRNFSYPRTAEMTIEVNPESVDLSKAKLLHSLGFNRVSLGIQSFQDRYLTFLGRNHNRQTAVRAFDILTQSGFDNISVDLMFAFPGQTTDELQADLEAVTDLGSQHVSLYNLTIEEHSRFYARKVSLDHEDIQAAHYESVRNHLEDHGFAQYEISNFAKPGFESRHNLNYWQGGNYIGLGVGAHSHIDGRRFWNGSSLPQYFAQVKAEQPTDGEEQLDPPARLMELIVFGLRMNAGIALQDAERKAGTMLNADKREILDRFVREGFLLKIADRYAATDQGRLVLDELSARLI